MKSNIGHDYKVDWFSGTGKGGQHRNKHQNCCRVTHISTGITANGTSSRSRKTNYETALSVCMARVQALNSEDIERYRASAERVRTYHHADNRVVDHATGIKDTYDNVMEKKGIDRMIEERCKLKNMEEWQSG